MPDDLVIFVRCNSAAEKRAFRDAADVAGLDLSAWVRERLRASARKELQGVGKKAAFLVSPGRPDRLTSARYAGASKVYLAFADGLFGTWSFRQLELDMRDMKPATISSNIFRDEF